MSAAHPRISSRDLLPATAPAPGELLWGEPVRRQPIAPLVLMAFVLLLVAAPSALGGGGGTSNPMVLMRQVADSTWELTGLMQESNESLGRIDSNSRNLLELQKNMGGIAGATKGMETSTAQLNERLGGVADSVSQSGTTLASVDTKLGSTASGMGGLKADVSGAGRSTEAIVGEFGKINGAIGSMETNLHAAVEKMAQSAPLTKAFADNRTRVEIAGGSSDKYGVPNLAAQSRVMSVVLPMIQVMQRGGPLPARKDRHEASNPIVGTALKLQVPDGVNVVALVRPFDGFYGLPNEQFFVENRVYGF